MSSTLPRSIPKARAERKWRALIGHISERTRVATQTGTKKSPGQQHTRDNQVLLGGGERGPMEAKRRISYGFLVFGLVPLWTTSCGADSSPTDNNSLIASSLTIAATQGSPDVEYFMASSPYASCRIHGVIDSPQDSGLRVVGDMNGSVRFFGPSVVPEGLSVLDCRDQVGNQLPIQPISAKTLRVAPPRGAGVAAPQRPLPGSHVRPALVGDPNAPSQDELAIAGYPRRPDLSTSPAAYAVWMNAVQRPVQMVEAAGVSVPDRAEDYNSLNWAGQWIQGGQKYYYATSSLFQQPDVTVHGTLDVTPLIHQITEKAYFFVAMDGIKNASVVQAGTFGNYTKTCNQDNSACVYYSAYWAFVEWYPDDPVLISNLTIYPGNYYSIQVYMGDANGAYNPSGADLWASIFEQEDGPGVSGCFGPDSGCSFGHPTKGQTFGGATAEWIVERPPPLSGQNVTLSNFASATFNYATAAAQGVSGGRSNVTDPSTLACIVSAASTQTGCTPVAPIYLLANANSTGSSLNDPLINVNWMAYQ